MKKRVYILLFMLTGLLFQFLLHAMIEVAYIDILEIDFAKYSLSMTWAQLMTIHHIFTAVLALLGIAAGYFLGHYWWQVLYIEKKYKKDLKVDF